MAIDVETEVTIARPRAEVAAYASEPDNATRWYANIESAEWRTPRPLAVGSRFAFVARFMGRRLAYTYEVKELVPGERFVMATAEGPFAMETTYTWADAGDGATSMRLRNRGEPARLGLEGPLGHRHLGRLAEVAERELDQRLDVVRVGVLPHERVGEPGGRFDRAELAGEEEGLVLRRLHLDPVGAFR